MNAIIIVVANKWWETVPLIAALQHGNPAQPHLSAIPQALVDASESRPSLLWLPSPRLLLRCRTVNVELWCVQDLMDPTQNSSLTWEKARVLPRILRDKERQSLVIAFGTAACPHEADQNGMVFIGTSVFVHDPYDAPPDPAKHWTHPRLNEIVTSQAQPLFDRLSHDFVKEAEARMLTPPHASAKPPRVNADSKLISVGVVNVTKTADYAWADQQALAKLKEVTGFTSSRSLETTHGVIRLVLDAPFVYVSGIANAVGHFSDHVGPNPYSQNFVAAHNAGIALAWLLPELTNALLSS